MADDFMKWALQRAKEVTGEVGGSAQLLGEPDAAERLSDDQLFEQPPSADAKAPPTSTGPDPAVGQSAPAAAEPEVLSEAAQNAPAEERVRVVDDGSNPRGKESFRWPKE